MKTSKKKVWTLYFSAVFAAVVFIWLCPPWVETTETHWLDRPLEPSVKHEPATNPLRRGNKIGHHWIFLPPKPLININEPFLWEDDLGRRTEKLVGIKPSRGPISMAILSIFAYSGVFILCLSRRT